MAVGYCALLVFQHVILPASPMIIATSFTIFATYTRRMFPCLMTGSLMLKCTPLRYLIVGLRQLHIPQKLIVAISVTLRYFPAIREEIGHIRDAMKLRNIRGLSAWTCTVMPLMVSALCTASFSDCWGMNARFPCLKTAACWNGWSSIMLRISIVSRKARSCFANTDEVFQNEHETGQREFSILTDAGYSGQEIILTNSLCVWAGQNPGQDLLERTTAEKSHRRAAKCS